MFFLENFLKMAYYNPHKNNFFTKKAACSMEDPSSLTGHEHNLGRLVFSDLYTHHNDIVMSAIHKFQEKSTQIEGVEGTIAEKISSLRNLFDETNSTESDYEEFSNRIEEFSKISSDLNVIKATRACYILAVKNFIGRLTCDSENKNPLSSEGLKEEEEALSLENKDSLKKYVLDGKLLKINSLYFPHFYSESESTFLNVDRKFNLETSKFGLLIQKVQENRFKSTQLYMNRELFKKLTAAKKDVDDAKAAFSRHLNKDNGEWIQKIKNLISAIDDEKGTGSTGKNEAIAKLSTILNNYVLILKNKTYDQLANENQLNLNINPYVNYFSNSLLYHPTSSRITIQYAFEYLKKAHQLYNQINTANQAVKQKESKLGNKLLTEWEQFNCKIEREQSNNEETSSIAEEIVLPVVHKSFFQRWQLLPAGILLVGVIYWIGSKYLFHSSDPLETDSV